MPPPSPFPLQGLLACTQLRCLNLATTGLLHWPMPPVPWAMPALQELVLQRNVGIREVPMGAFACCPALLRLDLSGEGGCRDRGGAHARVRLLSGLLRLYLSGVCGVQGESSI